MAWTNINILKSGDFWDYNLPNNIYNNLIYIRDRLVTKGYSVQEFTPIDFSLGYATNIKDIKAKLNAIENNINILNASLTDFIEYYYGSAVNYGRFAPKLAELNRWINICNNLRSIAYGEKQKTVYINKSGNILCLSNGDKLLIQRGGYIV